MAMCHLHCYSLDHQLKKSGFMLEIYAEFKQRCMSTKSLEEYPYATGAINLLLAASISPAIVGVADCRLPSIISSDVACCCRPSSFYVFGRV